VGRGRRNCGVVRQRVFVVMEKWVDILRVHGQLDRVSWIHDGKGEESGGCGSGMRSSSGSPERIPDKRPRCMPPSVGSLEWLSTDDGGETGCGNKRAIHDPGSWEIVLLLYSAVCTSFVCTGLLCGPGSDTLAHPRTMQPLT